MVATTLRLVQSVLHGPIARPDRVSAPMCRCARDIVTFGSGRIGAPGADSNVQEVCP